MKRVNYIGIPNNKIKNYYIKGNIFNVILYIPGLFRYMLRV